MEVVSKTILKHNLMGEAGGNREKRMGRGGAFTLVTREPIKLYFLKGEDMGPQHRKAKLIQMELGRVALTPLGGAKSGGGHKWLSSLLAL